MEEDSDSDNASSPAHSQALIVLRPAVTRQGTPVEELTADGRIGNKYKQDGEKTGQQYKTEKNDNKRQKGR